MRAFVVAGLLSFSTIVGMVVMADGFAALRRRWFWQMLAVTYSIAAIFIAVIFAVRNAL